jgi:hypothetical protein
MIARRSTSRIVAPLALPLILALYLLPLQAVRAASDPCQPPNVLPAAACDFDDWHGDRPRQVANGWNEYILSGNPDYYRDEHSFFGGGTQTMRSGAPFLAGIWTQIEVTPGAGYRGSVAWGAPNLPAEFGRQLGLDPTGGTDPSAATVIWGPQHFGDGRMLNYITDGPNIDIRARAVSDRMTLFFQVDRPTSSGDGFIFIDAIALYPDESAPDLIEAPPAPTAAPVDAPVDTNPEEPAPGATSVEFLPITVAEAAPSGQQPPVVDVEPAPLPTDTPTVAVTATTPPTATPLSSATPTATPSSTPTLTATPSPSPTPSPTWTPWPTVIPMGFIDAAGTALRVGDIESLREAPSSTWALSILSAVALLGALLFGGSLFWLRR